MFAFRISEEEKSAMNRQFDSQLGERVLSWDLRECGYGQGCFVENLRKEVTKLMEEQAIYHSGNKSKSRVLNG